LSAIVLSKFSAVRVTLAIIQFSLAIDIYPYG
jgi:hypothetical protein